MHDELAADNLNDHSIALEMRDAFEHGCEWPGCDETEKLKLGATAEESFPLCHRHAEAVRKGVFEIRDMPARGSA